MTLLARASGWNRLLGLTSTCKPRSTRVTDLTCYSVSHACDSHLKHVTSKGYNPHLRICIMRDAPLHGLPLCMHESFTAASY